MDSPTTELLTAEQVSATYRFVTAKTLANWRCSGRGPKFIKAGHRILYRAGDVREWLDSNVFASTSGYKVK